MQIKQLVHSRYSTNDSYYYLGLQMFPSRGLCSWQRIFCLESPEPFQQFHFISYPQSVPEGSKRPFHPIKCVYAKTQVLGSYEHTPQLFMFFSVQLTHMRFCPQMMRQVAKWVLFLTIFILIFRHSDVGDQRTSQSFALKRRDIVLQTTAPEPHPFTSQGRPWDHSLLIVDPLDQRNIC